MLYSLDARRDRLLTNSPCTQTSGAELPTLVGSLHEGSSVRLTQPSIGEVPTAAPESCRLVPRWSSLQVPSRDIRTSGHASRRVHKTTFPQPIAAGKRGFDRDMKFDCQAYRRESSLAAVAELGR